MMLRKYLWVFYLLVIALCAGLVGRAAASVLVSTVLHGDGPPMPRREVSPQVVAPPQRGKDIEAILDRNIFCSTCAPVVLTPEKHDEGQGPVDTTPQRSTLNMQLLATMVAPSDFEWSMAVVRDNADERKGVRIYKRGDALPQGGAIVAQVVEGRVYFVVGKRIEYLDESNAPPPPPPAVAAAEPQPGEATGLEKDIDKGVRCSGSSCEVDKSLIDKVLANTTALATSARFVPSIKDNKPNGFKLYAIRPGSMFAKIGMQNADLIKAINGLDMSTPDKALEAYTKLKTASHLTVMLERRGENITLDYQIR
jgi:general secretion pathway protein C